MPVPLDGDITVIIGNVDFANVFHFNPAVAVNAPSIAPGRILFFRPPSMQRFTLGAESSTFFSRQQGFDGGENDWMLLIILDRIDLMEFVGTLYRLRAIGRIANV